MLAAHGLTRAEADQSAWVIERGGRRLEGAAALSRPPIDAPEPVATLSID